MDDFHKVLPPLSVCCWSHPPRVELPRPHCRGACSNVLCTPATNGYNIHTHKNAQKKNKKKNFCASRRWLRTGWIRVRCKAWGSSWGWSLVDLDADDPTGGLQVRFHENFPKNLQDFESRERRVLANLIIIHVAELIWGSTAKGVLKALSPRCR